VWKLAVFHTTLIALSTKASAETQVATCFPNWKVGPDGEQNPAMDLLRNTRQSVSHCQPGDVLHYSPARRTRVHAPILAAALRCDFATTATGADNIFARSLACVMGPVREERMAPPSPPG
jgi:hypothetical protein